MSVRLRGLGHAYEGNAWAVRDLDLDVADRELLVVLGPSGCGKSTLLRLLAGLDEPTQGTIEVDGRSARGLTPRQRDVALVFQDHSLFPHLSAAENMGYGLRLRGVSRQEVEGRVQEAAQRLGVTGLLGRRPSEMSGGERQRVALGRVLVRRPRLVLLDEPLSRLDAHLRRELRAEIRRLHGLVGATTVLVTHDQDEAAGLADRVAVMRDGRILQVATPAVLRTRPRDRFVAGFVGLPPMNFVPGRFEVRPDRALFRGEECALPIPSSWSRALAGREGENVTLGIRPDALRSGPSGEGAFEGRVVDVEPAGDRWACRLQASGVAMVALADGDPPRVGDRLAVRPDPRQLHFFDAVSGRAIDPGEEPDSREVST